MCHFILRRFQYPCGHFAEPDPVLQLCQAHIAYRKAMDKWEVGGYTRVPRPIDHCPGVRNWESYKDDIFSVCPEGIKLGNMCPVHFNGPYPGRRLVFLAL